MRPDEVLGRSPGEHDQLAPVVVLAYSQSGVGILRQQVQGESGVEWIDAPGLAQVCGRIDVVWSRISGHPGDGRSQVGLVTVRSLLQSMLVPRLARAGRRSWWALITAVPVEGVEYLAEIYPAARFVCLHRRCDEVVRAALSSAPWGLGGAGQGFDTFVYENPGNSIAAAVSYWKAHTEAALQFEAKFQERCLRVHYEELVSDAVHTTARIMDYAGGHEERAAVGWEAAALAEGAELPIDRIPAHLLSQVNAIMAELRYAPIVAR